MALLSRKLVFVDFCDILNDIRSKLYPQFGVDIEFGFDFRVDIFKLGFQSVLL